jgi:hypothetical protein
MTFYKIQTGNEVYKLVNDKWVFLEVMKDTMIEKLKKKKKCKVLDLR